jgi:hypothetical protein
MTSLRWIGVAGLLLLVCGLVTGCSSTSGTAGSPADGLAIPKIREYVGDGGGSAKPWPGFIPRPEQADALGQLLGFGAWPRTTFVPAKQTYWLRLPAINNNSTIVVTLQPTADEDADLFLLRGRASDCGGPEDDCLGYSARAPALGSPPDPLHGYAPDWVAFTPGNTSGFPAAQVAVYGIATGATSKHFWVEADRVSPRTVNGGVGTYTLTGGNSNWYSFSATSGLQYTVTLSISGGGTGDPDSYVYGDNSSKFVVKCDGAGGGDAVFTATETGTHYVRVFANAPGANIFSVQVTQP